MPDYELLDSGDSAKLERFGDVVLARPSPQALWTPRDRACWSQAVARFDRDEDGRGSWDPAPPRPAGWKIACGGLKLWIKPTSFGHLGLFPEQIAFWNALRGVCRPGMELLNLFAYTGGSSLAAASAGAAVTHLDAAKGIVDWARENADASDLGSAPIRWIVDDALKFVQREERRGHRYHGVVLDPPSFGRGSKGQVFKLERDLPKLLHACVQILHDDAAFVLLSGHTPGVGGLALCNLLADALEDRAGAWRHGEMITPGLQRNLPSGVWSVWTRSADDAAYFPGPGL